MIKMVKKSNESAERLISKFNKLFQGARIASQVQTKRYFRKKDNQRKSRIKAVKRDEYRAKREKQQYR